MAFPVLRIGHLDLRVASLIYLNLNINTINQAGGKPFPYFSFGEGSRLDDITPVRQQRRVTGFAFRGARPFAFLEGGGEFRVLFDPWPTNSLDTAATAIYISLPSVVTAACKRTQNFGY
jgi:hypothetical protein